MQNPHASPGDGSPLLDEQVRVGLQGDFQRGLEIANELEKKFPESHRAAFNRAWYKMMEGDLLSGLDCLDRGRWVNAFGGPPLQTTKTIYRDEILQGRHLLLTGEGGLGDEIINVRFAKNFAARGARVTVACDPSLARVFSRVEGVSAVVNQRAAAEVYHDFWVPSMSAARVLETTYEKIDGSAYLTADPELVKFWCDELKRQNRGVIPKIGLRFYGNQQFEHAQHRRFPAEGLRNAVGALPWVNLQKEESPLAMETWDDTLAIIANLDLVITSCTSVAHASAALGKETWVLVPLLPYYIWALPGDRSPWYKSVRLFRQTQFGEWKNVFDKIAFALVERAQ